MTELFGREYHEQSDIVTKCNLQQLYVAYINRIKSYEYMKTRHSLKGWGV